jgi:hypothetical protein
MSEALPFVVPLPSPWRVHCRKCNTTYTAAPWARLKLIGYQPDVDLPDAGAAQLPCAYRPSPSPWVSRDDGPMSNWRASAGRKSDALKAALQNEADRRRLEGWADAFMGLYLALAKFEARCLHERRQDCRYCEAREALKEARAAMAKETFPDGGF